jgi:hypothetical protein
MTIADILLVLKNDFFASEIIVFQFARALLP